MGRSAGRPRPKAEIDSTPEWLSPTTPSVSPASISQDGELTTSRSRPTTDGKATVRPETVRRGKDTLRKRPHNLSSPIKDQQAEIVFNIALRAMKAS